MTARAPPGFERVALLRHRDLMWIRQPLLRPTLDPGAVVVHDHCVSPRPQVERNRIGIDTGAWRTGGLTCIALEGPSRDVLQS